MLYKSDSEYANNRFFPAFFEIAKIDFDNINFSKIFLHYLT